MNKVKKIGLCGSHGVGKTSLIDNFIEINPEFVTVTEGIRKFVAEHGIEKEYKKGSETLQFIYLYNHILQIKNLDKFISDRTVLDNYAYYKSFGFDKLKNVYESLIEQNLKYYDVICYIPIEFKCENDGFRFDSKFQKDIDNSINEIFNQFGIEPYIISGTVEERINKLEKLV